ncbi:hypothetical protein C3V43_13635 [Bacteroides heparinolyticus]|nr:hypothetical protein C3V43_13635 [Bacteroides heparinolyticus]
MLNDIELKTGRQDEQIKHFNQLGASRRKIFKHLWKSTFFRLVFNICLPVIMIVSDFVFPIKNSICFLGHKQKKYPLKRLYLHHERRLLALSKTAGIQREDDVWFHNPFDFITLPAEYKSVCALDYVSMGEIWKSAGQAVILHIKTVISLGYDKYLLSFRAYEWCLTDFALRHIPLDVNMTFSCICDRMAILYDKLPHENKTMIQHGTMHFHNLVLEASHFVWQEDLGAYIWKSLYKSSPSTIYCYTKDDEIALSHSVIANNPKYIHMGYGFKPSFKPEKKSLLIVGQPALFFDNEREIIRQLQGLDVIIYLKNHPAETNASYYDLRKEFDFTFIEGLNTHLPAVDLLISYESTLAYEYASVGTKILYYGLFEINYIRNLVVKELGLQV